MLCGWAAGLCYRRLRPLRTRHLGVLSGSAFPFGPGVTQVPQFRGGPLPTRRDTPKWSAGRDWSRESESESESERERERGREGERERGSEGERERGRGGERGQAWRCSAAEILGGDPGLTATKGELPCAP